MKRYVEKDGITREHLKEAVEHVFNQPRTETERRVKFKVFFKNAEEAQKWYENFWLPLFRGEVQKQIDKLKTGV